MGSCNTVAPKWDGKLYAGSSATDGVERRQEGEVIKCADPKFDQMVCMTYADLEKFYSTYVLGCKEWKSKQLYDTAPAVKEFQAMRPKEGAE